MLLCKGSGVLIVLGAFKSERTLRTGQQEVASIGLYFYNARWYDSALGRFVQADSIIPNPGDPPSFDRFAYVRNNPIIYIDPTGHSSSYCDQYPQECIDDASQPACGDESDYEQVIRDGKDCVLVPVGDWHITLYNNGYTDYYAGTATFWYGWGGPGYELTPYIYSAVGPSFRGGIFYVPDFANISNYPGGGYISGVDSGEAIKDLDMDLFVGVGYRAITNARNEFGLKNPIDHSLPVYQVICQKPGAI